MFTGIIEARGKIRTIESVAGFLRIRVATETDLSEVKVGDSISVDGACLTATVVDGDGHGFCADVSPETMRVTTLGGMKCGDEVNLELAMRLDSRLGGHLVLGHVDCVGRIVEKRRSGNGHLMGFQADSGRYLIEKGSIAIDGVSLTVNEVRENRFRVMIVPHTGTMTGLIRKKIGDPVNIEYDMIGKYVEKFLLMRDTGSGVSEKTLREHGFM
jgi:riboflavin synthase